MLELIARHVWLGHIRVYHDFIQDYMNQEELILSQYYDTDH